ncbi:MAG: alpha-amylase family glycosyl hydrolase [Acholeplasma sp.]|nr:alpha-amylase family glycosyl hydrolase [Acholeplasma sp.]
MKKIVLLMIVVLTIVLTGCTKDNPVEPAIQTELKKAFPRHGNYYQVFVRSFADSDNDGIGDINGITENLDYLEDLGVNGLWLMPIHPSPSYHGYDVDDYYAINEDYGTLEDFDRLVDEADKRGINIIIDLVMNHTSNHHEWFIDHPEWYTSFSYFGAWMPELDYSKPEVRDAMLQVMKYWLDKGVSGFRVDAAIHLFNSKTYVNGLPATADIKQTVDYYTMLRAQLRKDYPELYLVGEVWASKDYTASFYQGFDSLFNFDYSTKVIDTVTSSNVSNYGSTINGYYRSFQNIMDSYNARFVNSNEIYIDAPFIKNHDQDRTASLINDTENVFAAEMLLALPGNPYVYYGEELGMKGVSSNGTNNVWDETRRLPFLWGTEDQTNWCTACVDYNKEVKPLSEQKVNESSLYNTYKTLLNLRNDYPALMYGTFELVDNDLSNVDVFKRTIVFGDYSQEVWVYHNFSNVSVNIDTTGYEVIYNTNHTDELEPMSSIYMVKK